MVDLQQLENNKFLEGTGYPKSTVRVILVDRNGQIIKFTQLEENRLGSEASGIDGDTARVLTLNNTSESGNPVSVWIDGQLISQTDMTITHKASSSTIEFAVNLYDSQNIRVLYYV